MDKEYYAKKTELSKLSQEVNNKANEDHSHLVSDILDIEDITDEIDSVEKTANQALSKAGQAYEIAIAFKKPIVIKGRVDRVGDLPNESSEVPPMEGWIYFVGEKSAESSYEEYIYIDDHWELIGTTAQGIDLTNVKISDLIDDTTEESHINWAENAKYSTNSGAAIKAGTADAIVDHSSISNKIYINYTGDGLGTDNIKYVAAFDSSGNIGKATVSNLIEKIKEENNLVPIRKVSSENTINFNTDFLLNQPDDPIKVIFDCSQGTNNYSTVGAPPLKVNPENISISFIMTVEKIYNATSYSLKQHCIVNEINNIYNSTISEYVRYKKPSPTAGIDVWTEWKSTKSYVPIVSIPYVTGEHIDLNDYNLCGQDTVKAIYEGTTLRPILSIENCPISMSGWGITASFLLTVERINVDSENHINKDIVKQHIIMYGTGSSERLVRTEEFIRYSYRNDAENTLDWTDWEEVNTVDSSLSDTSKNPVQNKVITEAINSKLDIASRNYIPIREIDSSVDFNTSFNLSEIDPDITVFTRNEGYVDSHGPIGSESLPFILIVERLYEKTNLYDKYYRQHYIGLSHMDTEQIKIVEYERIVKLEIMTGVYEFGVWKNLKVDVDTDLSGTSSNPVQNKAIVEALSKQITAPTSASVGEILAVESVDENGKPIKWKTISTGEISSGIEIDSALSLTSENPVQNKVITSAFSKQITSPTEGRVGQLLAVESVNENNKPTSWKTVDVADISTDITVDDALSTTSTNPVQNRVVEEAIRGHSLSINTLNYTKIDSPDTGEEGQLLVLKSLHSGENPTKCIAVDGAPKIVQEYMEGGSGNLPVLLGEEAFKYNSDGIVVKENKTCAAKRNPGIVYNPNSQTLKVSKVEANLAGNASTATNADHATSADSATTAESANTAGYADNAGNAGTATVASRLKDASGNDDLVKATNQVTSLTDNYVAAYDSDNVINKMTFAKLSEKVASNLSISDLTDDTSTSPISKATNAAKADLATSIVDYAQERASIQIGYSGNPVSAGDADYVAVYTNGSHIKDMTFDSLASKLTSNSNFRPIQYSTSEPGSSLTTGTIWIQYES